MYNIFTLGGMNLYYTDTMFEIPAFQCLMDINELISEYSRKYYHLHAT